VSTFKRINSSYTAQAGDVILADTSAGAFTITLPASPSFADSVEIYDATGSCETNAVTISPNGAKIEGFADNRTMSVSRSGMRLTYYDPVQGWVRTAGVPG
jgi:hypothetical protein